MKAITYNTKKEKINWLFPDKNPEDMIVTMDDFREMVHEAEKDKGISLAIYKEKMDAWWRDHL